LLARPRIKFVYKFIIETAVATAAMISGVFSRHGANGRPRALDTVAWIIMAPEMFANARFS
jgi:hypothetical protein